MIKNFFSPRSIAVIGASDNPEKLGNVIMKNLITHGFTKKLYPVNPKKGIIEGKTVYASVKEIPGAVDLALIVIPADFVAQVLRECGSKKIKSAVIISAGFGEQNEAGKRREESLKEIARKYHIRLLGPNCLGLIVPRIHMNASFASGMPEDGSVAVISQSGAMAVAITDWALSTGLGFSSLVSLGNKADVDERELLVYFGDDRKTKAIVMYLESLKTGRPLLKTIKKVTKLKPVVIVLPGKSPEAQAAVASHTGSLAGAHDVHNAALANAGAIIAKSLEELFTYTKVFEKPPRLKNKRIAIVTNAGGPGILATDAISASKLKLASLNEQTKVKLRKALPPAASINNPVDVIGDAPASRYASAVELVLQDSKVDAVVALLTHQYVTETESIAKKLVGIQKKYPAKPIIASFIGGLGVAQGRKILSAAKIPQFSYPEQAVRALEVVYEFRSGQNVLRAFPEAKSNLAKKHVPLLGKKAEKLLARYTTDVIASSLVKSIPEAHRAAKKLSYPLVAKIIHRSMLHKTDVDAVRVNIISPEQLEKTIVAWQKKFHLHFGKDEGYLLQPFKPGQLEMFLGAKRDATVGPYLIIGIGGVFVKELAQNLITLAPVQPHALQNALEDSPLGKMIHSGRGKRLPWKSVIRLVSGVSRMMMEKENILECDLNPVILSENSLSIVDVRLIVRS